MRRRDLTKRPEAVDPETERRLAAHPEILSLRRIEAYVSAVNDENDRLSNALFAVYGRDIFANAEVPYPVFFVMMGNGATTSRYGMPPSAYLRQSPWKKIAVGHQLARELLERDGGAILRTA